MVKSYLLGELTYREVEEALSQGFNKLIIPVGTVEAHGPHLPLDTDTLIPNSIAIELASRLKALIAPPIHYGVTSSLLRFAGTSTVSEETLKRVIIEVILSFRRHGFELFIILNGHGGNRNAIKSAQKELWMEHSVKTISVDWWIFVKNVTNEVFGEVGAHGGVDETAMILAKYPDLVREDLYSKNEVRLHEDGLSVYPEPGSIIIYRENEGLPKFNKELAEKYFVKVVEFLEKRLKSVISSIL